LIVVVDYGLGNVLAFTNIYKRLNIPFKVAQTADQLKGATKIIFPGVGSFDYAITRLNESGMRARLDDLVLEQEVPILGICVGMQMLACSSEEGELSGLGWIDGVVKKIVFCDSEAQEYLPHMGWNSIQPLKSSKILTGFDHTSRFYFLHSYYFECESEESTLASSRYGQTFSSIVNSKNVYGIQCHPEKSHGNGIRLLKNFAEL